ncbi:protein SENSITIVE TO UV 2-like [Aristolochia californica]|uniref:protein SENSITIVE TO UV 2-like n=1 Tax=Aristolochia californica TaxID=171875 RepID=UPI0035DE4249
MVIKITKGRRPRYIFLWKYIIHIPSSPLPVVRPRNPFLTSSDAFEGFDEWDEKFLDQAIRLEEVVIATRNATQALASVPPSTRQTVDWNVSFSPPRELSQRPNSSSLPEREWEAVMTWNASLPLVGWSGKDNEIERLKKKLSRVSKQLNHLQHECLVLKKERDRKDEQLKNAFSQIEAKNVEIDCLRIAHTDYEATIQDHASLQPPGTSTALGRIGTGDYSSQVEGASSITSVREGIPKYYNAKNLKYLLSKIFVACASEFYELLRCKSSSSRTNMDSLRDQRFNVTLHEEILSVESAEAAKLTRLFTLLTELSNGMTPLDNLLEALLNLCFTEKLLVLLKALFVQSDVVQRSLHILHLLLQHTLNIGTQLSKRDNVVITHPYKPISSEDKINNSLLNEIKRFRDIEKVITGVQSVVNQDQELSQNLFSSRAFDMENIVHEGSSCEGLFSPVYLLSVFEMMHRITTRNNEVNIRVEAIIIMNLILMRTNPNSERERFGSVPIFESLTWLLRKEVGFLVQMQALRLLFLLLNCPRLLMMFCDEHKDVHLVEGSVGGKSSAVLQGTTVRILEGLTECLACKGSGPQEIKLRRHAITVLAFIASSGKCGFEILLNLSSSKGRMNFLELIVRVLTSEIGAQAVEMVETQEASRERFLLVREALILLNRLASNPVYSTSVLGVLTSSRSMANLTIDVVDNISRKNRGFLKYDGSKKMRTKESELVELTNSFRTRILTFLCDNIP